MNNYYLNLDFEKWLDEEGFRNVFESKIVGKIGLILVCILIYSIFS